MGGHRHTDDDPGRRSRGARPPGTRLALRVILGAGILGSFLVLAAQQSQRAHTLVAAQATAVDVHVTDPGGSSPGTPIDVTSFAAAQADVASNGSIRLEWPGADSLGDTTVTGAAVTVDSSAQAIVLDGSVDLDGVGLQAMIVLDWNGTDPTPIISLGVRGDFDVATLNPSWRLNGSDFVIDGVAAIATGPQPVGDIAGASAFYGDIDELDARFDIAGTMTLGSILPGVGDDASLAIAVTGSFEADIAALLTARPMQPSDPGAVTFTASIEADDLSLPAVPGLTATSFGLQIDLAGDEETPQFDVRADGSITIDDDRVSSSPVTFAVAFTRAGDDVTLSGGLAPGSTWEDPFGAGGVSVGALAVDLTGDGTLSLTGEVEIGGVGISATISAGSDLSVDLAIDRFTVAQAVDVFAALGVEVGALDSLADELAALAIGPTSITLDTDGGDVAGVLSTSVTFRGKTALLLLSGSTAADAPLLAAVELPPVTVGDLAPSAPGLLAAVPLPAGGFIVSSDDIAKSSLPADGPSDQFLSRMYCGATVDAGDCDFDVPSGLSIAARIELDEGIRETLSALAPLGPEPLRVEGTLPVFGQGEVALTVQLPTIRPDPNGEVGWLVEGRVSLRLTAGGGDVSVALVGELDTRLPDETEADGFDEVTFTVDAELSLGTSGVGATIGAEVGTWPTPFGIDWVDLNGFRLEIQIEVAPVSVQIGLGASATLRSPCSQFGGSCPPPSTFEAAFAIKVTPAVPVPIIQFGFRVYADAITLRDVAAISAEMGAPSLDPSSLPDISLRNAEFAFSVVDAPNLCLAEGLIVSADLYLDSPQSSTGPGDAVDRELCTDTRTSPTQGFDRCVADSACFAHMRLDVSQQGVVATAALGALDFGPVDVHGAAAALVLTPSEQSLTVAGSVSVEGFVSADGSLSISNNGVAFSLSTVDLFGNEVTMQGSAGLDPTVPGFAFDLRVFVQLPGLSAALEGAQDVVDFLSTVFTGEPLETRYSLRCLELDLDLVVGGSTPIAGNIATKVHFSAIDSDSGYEDGRVWEIGWDFDASVASNVSGLVDSLSGATATDVTGCAEGADIYFLQVNDYVRGTGGANLPFATIAPGVETTVRVDVISADFSLFTVELDAGDGRGPQRTTLQMRRFQDQPFVFSVQYPDSDQPPERRQMNVRVRAGGSDGPVVSQQTIPVVVGGAKFTDHTLADLGSVDEGDRVSVAARWTGVAPSTSADTRSRFRYGVRGLDGSVVLLEEITLSNGDPEDFPEGARGAHQAFVDVPASCFGCQLVVIHTLLTADGQVTSEQVRQAPVRSSVPEITGVEIDGDPSENLTAGTAPVVEAFISDTRPPDEYVVSVNGVAVFSSTSPGKVTFGLTTLYEEGRSKAIDIVVRRVDDPPAAVSPPVRRNVTFLPTNTASSSPREISLQTVAEVSVTSTTRFPIAADDVPDPFGSVDCGAVWFEVSRPSDGPIEVSTRGSYTAVPRGDGSSNQDVAIAVFDGNVLVAELAPDQNLLTVSSGRLTWSADADVVYLVAIAAADHLAADGCGDSPTRSGPLVATFRQTAIPPEQDFQLGRFSNLDPDGYLATETLNALNDEFTTQLGGALGTANDDFAYEAAGFDQCFDDPLEQTVWYLFFPPIVATSLQSPLDVIVQASDEDDDIQIALFNANNDTTINSPTLIGCAETSTFAEVADADFPDVARITFDPRDWPESAYLLMVDTNGFQDDVEILPFLTGARSNVLGIERIDIGDRIPVDNRFGTGIFDNRQLRGAPCSDKAFDRNHWFVWTADSPTPVDFGTPTGSADVALVAIDIDDGEDVVACSDAPGSRPETLRLNPTVGTTYALVAATEGEPDARFDIELSVRADKAVNELSVPFGQFPIRASMSNVGATSDGDPTCFADTTSVWHRFKVPIDVDIDIDTFGSGFDTRLAVSDIAGNTVGCNDDTPLSSFLESSVTVPAVGFVDYFVRVDGFGGAQGPISLNITTASDDVRHARILTGTAAAGAPIVDTLNNQLASVEPAERYGACYFEGDTLKRTVWWSWTAPADVNGLYDVAVTGFDAQLTVFDDAGGRPGSIIGCGEDEGPGLTPRIDLGVPAGETVWFQVDGWKNSFGDATISIEFIELLDRDDDGIIDDDDNCVDDANPTQTDTDDDTQGDACDPDDDNDNINDTTDNCPTTPNPTQTNTDNDTQGDACDPDDDNDTINDTTDNCPTTPNTDQADTDDDGVGDACSGDPDGDGRIGDDDNCPTVPNSTQFDGDDDGIGDACDRSEFTALTPARLVDTRPGAATIDGRFAGDGPIAAGETYEVQIAGRGGIAPDASAAVLNLTTLGPEARGFLTLHPCGERPLAAGINYEPGQITNNEIVTKLSAAGTVCVYAEATTGLVVDAVSYTTPIADYRPLIPSRAVDTRPTGETADGLFAGDGPIAGGDTYEVQIAGRNGVAPDATAAAMNLTTVGPVGTGFLTIHPCGERPLAAGINYGPGQIANNEIIAKLSDRGTICIFAQTTTGLVIDIVGDVPASADYTPITPARLVDTRAAGSTVDDIAAADGALVARGTREIQIAGRGGVAPGASVAVLNLTTVQPEATGFLTIFPCGDQPLAAGINYATGEVANNEIIATLSDAGTICIYAETSTHLVVDAVGHA